jgi:hypothetical protein
MHLLVHSQLAEGKFQVTKASISGRQLVAIALVTVTTVHNIITAALI